MTSEGRAGEESALPDLVYRIRPGENEELRYSLRSMVMNGSGLFDKVWVVVSSADGSPGWLTNVNVLVAGVQVDRKEDVRAKAALAANHSGVASRFLLVDDDHFLVERVARWAAFHMGPTSEYLRLLAREPWNLTTDNSRWVRTIISTADWMAEQGYGDVLVRQGHRPLLWSKSKLAAALRRYPAGRLLDVCGLYDIAGAAGKGRRAGNSKVTSDPVMFRQKVDGRDSPWLSSNDQSFKSGLIGDHIRRMFTDPSIYER